MKPDNRLGRGISIFMSNQLKQIDGKQQSRAQREINKDELANASDTLQFLDIENVSPNPNQPRKNFDQDAIAELSVSIMNKGVLQPIIVKYIEDDRYEIISGERRWRASKLAGIQKIPAIIKKIDESEAYEIAIIENIQRDNLSTIEEAEAYQYLTNQYGYKQEEIAKAVAKSRSHIANLLRILSLPSDVRELIRCGKISVGHAKTLVGNPNASKLAREIADNNISVRETARITQSKNNIKRINEIISSEHGSEHGDVASGGNQNDNDERSAGDPDILILEENIQKNLGVSIKITKITEESGSVIIHYSNINHFDKIIQKLS